MSLYMQRENVKQSLGLYENEREQRENTEKKRDIFL